MSDDPLVFQAKAFHRSGMFPDLQNAEQAYVKLVAGREMGIGPMAAMSGIQIIQGKPTLSANLLAAAVKRHPRYDYLVEHHDGTSCRLSFHQDGRQIGVSDFSLEDAARAGLKGPTWQKYPEALLFARALTQGVRWYCPDVTAGPAYTPEELGQEPADEELEPVGSAPATPMEVLGGLVEQRDLDDDQRRIVRDFIQPEEGQSPLAVLVEEAVLALEGEGWQDWLTALAWQKAKRQTEEAGLEPEEVASE